MRQPRQEGRPARPRPRPRLTHRPASRLGQAWRERSTTQTSSSSPDGARGGRSRYHSTCLSGRGGHRGPCERGSGSSPSPARHRSRPPALGQGAPGFRASAGRTRRHPPPPATPRPAPPPTRRPLPGVVGRAGTRGTARPPHPLDSLPWQADRRARHHDRRGLALEESRIKAAEICRRPAERSWLHAAASGLVLADFFTPTCTSTLALRAAPLQPMHRVRLPPAAAHQPVIVRSGLMPVRLWCRGQAWRLGRRWSGVIDTRPDQPARTPPPGTRDVSGATGVRAQHHPPARTHRHHRQPPPATGRAGCRPPSSPTTTHRRAIATASPR
ncbi:hypothetical protein amrb99_55070 [Actinomadura sp. RB99]|nr:hypothetical protein [Actinomadura sp. RB99]